MEAKAPDKLYIICDAANNRGMTVATEKPMFSDDICYIRRGAILELLRAKHAELDPPGNERDFGRLEAVEEFTEKLQSL